MAKKSYNSDSDQALADLPPASSSSSARGPRGPSMRDLIDIPQGREKPTLEIPDATGMKPVLLYTIEAETGRPMPIQWSRKLGGITLNVPNGFAHSSLSGLIAPADDHTQYALLAGRAGGQTYKGGSNAADKLTLRGNSVDADGGAVNVQVVETNDAAGDPTSAGRLQRNAAKLKWHDGTAVRRLLLQSNVDPTDAQMLIWVAATAAWVATAISGDFTISNAGVATIANAAVSLSGAKVTGILPLANGGTNANNTASNGGMLWSDASKVNILAGTATANKLLYSGATATPAWSVPTFPVTASATAGKMIVSDGTNYVASTPTWPNAAPAAGTFPRGDGTNFVTSTLTIPNAATTGDVIVATGSNALGSLAIGSNGKSLRAVSGAPAWAFENAWASGTSITTPDDCGKLFDVDCTSATNNLNLPAVGTGAGQAPAGFTIGFRRGGANSTTNTLTITPSGTDRVDVYGGTGAAVYTLSAEGAQVWLMSTGVTGGGIGKGWVVIRTHGDYVVGTGSAVSLTQNGGYTNILSTFTLTPGEWDINLVAVAVPSSSTTITPNYLFGVSTDSAANGFSDSVTGDNLQYGPGTTNIAYNVGVVVAGLRKAISANQIYYVKCLFTWTGTAPTASCRISGRRVR